MHAGTTPCTWTLHAWVGRTPREASEPHHLLTPPPSGRWAGEGMGCAHKRRQGSERQRQAGPTKTLERDEGWRKKALGGSQGRPASQPASQTGSVTRTEWPPREEGTSPAGVSTDHTSAFVSSRRTTSSLSDVPSLACTRDRRHRRAWQTPRTLGLPQRFLSATRRKCGDSGWAGARPGACLGVATDGQHVALPGDEHVAGGGREGRRRRRQRVRLRGHGRWGRQLRRQRRRSAPRQRFQVQDPHVGQVPATCCRRRSQHQLGWGGGALRDNSTRRRETCGHVATRSRGCRWRWRLQLQRLQPRK
jgi:hypothetical protein